MNIALKCTTLVVSILVGMEMVAFGSLTSASYAAVDTVEDVPRLEVSDVAYVPSAEDGAKAKEAMKKAVAEPKEVIAKSDEVESGETVVGPEEAIVESEEVTVESDLVSGEADTEDMSAELGFDEESVQADAEDTQTEPEQGFYDEIAAAYGLTPYDGSGYYDANMNGVWHEGSGFAYTGGYLYKDGSGMEFTWYPEDVLPGGGLDIPGRHVGDEGYICDENGNVCLASDYLPKGTVVNIPFGSGTGVVYDSGCGYNDLDVYVSW